MAKKLLVLSCSQSKTPHDQQLPALEVYNGPYYKVLRKFLREYEWPSGLSISTLSAKHGLFGVIKDIEHYDQRMDECTANQWAQACRDVIDKWAPSHESVHVALGREYAPAIDSALESTDLHQDHFLGGIGLKQKRLKNLLYEQGAKLRTRRQPQRHRGTVNYFVPDWDDLLDPGFDFEADGFSGPTRESRMDKHCQVLMKPTQMCDGILVSLAQRQTSKGPLKRLEGTELDSLSPKPLREFYGLTENQLIFGDCGAFSYVEQPEPAISSEQAACLYDLYGFDLGASVDHIPFGNLSAEERHRRVEVTRNNAQHFIDICRRRGMPFTPVGSIQGISPAQYAEQVGNYSEMGYGHLAIGGLVPLGDQQIIEIVERVTSAAQKLPKRPWIHLFGVYRPRLQTRFRTLGVDSFDSASYFRKAWLRSDQNYFSQDGTWYAAIRVPMTSDPRTRRRLRDQNLDLEELEREERQALSMLNRFDRGLETLEEVLDAIMHYDSHLQRASDGKSMREKYRRTLEDKPWRKCGCTFCKQLGIHIAVFRGGNRNKRRGAHNTALLYQSIKRTQ